MNIIISLASSPWTQLALTICAAIILLLLHKNKIRWHTTPAICLSFIASIIVAFYALQGFPASGIEESFLIQGKIFSSGSLWLDETPMSKYLFNRRMVVQEGKIVSQFTPGFPLILAPLYLLRIPDYILNPVLGALCLIIFLKILQRLKLENDLALTALAFSPFFIFNNASYFSHSSGAFCVLLAVYAYIRIRDSKLWPALLGFSLAYAFLIRPYTALFIAAPLAIAVLCRNPRSILISALAASPVMICFFYYNYLITGDPFVDPFSWKYLENNPAKVMKVNSSSVPRMLEKIAVLGVWFNPIIMILALWKMLSRLIHRTPAVFDFMTISLACGYFLFPDYAGNQYGPRYLFEAFPLLCLGLAMPNSKISLSTERSLINAGIISMLLAMPAMFLWVKAPVDYRISFRQKILQESEPNSIQIFKGPATQIVSIADLAQNSLNLKDAVLFAWDAGEKNCEFRKYYPNRKIYLIETRDKLSDYSRTRICE